MWSDGEKRAGAKKLGKQAGGGTRCGVARVRSSPKSGLKVVFLSSSLATNEAVALLPASLARQAPTLLEDAVLLTLPLTAAPLMLAAHSWDFVFFPLWFCSLSLLAGA